MQVLMAILAVLKRMVGGDPPVVLEPPPPAAPSPRPSTATADFLSKPRTGEDYRAILRNTNVQAFLRVIRALESSATSDEAYQALYGWRPGNGKVFVSFADHPRIAISTPWGWTSAAGAYQAMCAVPGKVKTDTWGDFVRSAGPHDFSPASQDIFAVWCIARRGALVDVMAGRLEAAVAKCAKEWASFPGSPYGQPTKTMDQVRAIYRTRGGVEV